MCVVSAVLCVMCEQYDNSRKLILDQEQEKWEYLRLMGIQFMGEKYFVERQSRQSGNIKGVRFLRVGALSRRQIC